MTTLDLGPMLSETLIRATVLLVGALLLSIPLKRASASSRHAFWTATTLALLALPVLQARLPQLEMPWWTATAPIEQPLVTTTAGMAGASDGAIATSVIERIPASVTADDSAMADPGWSLTMIAALAWLFGALGFALPIVAGLVRARRLAARAVPCRETRLLERFAMAKRAVGVRRQVALLLSEEARTPMTGGAARPVVVLPASAPSWSDDRLDAVLHHELIHVRRADALRQLASRCSVALYWFHPLAWRTARLGASAREQACDEAVLRLGTRPSHYARHLLELAEPTPIPDIMPAVVRLDHPDLEERVMAILRATPAPASRRLTVLSTLGIVAWSLGVAAAAPAQAPPAAPTAPRAPTAPVVAMGPVAPVAPSADVTVLAPVPPMAPLAVEAPEAPAPVVVPMPPDAPPTDCEIAGGGYRTTGSSEARPVRMMSTSMGDTRLCVSIRGKTSEANGLIPARPLPAGVLLTLASSGPGGSQRLEITGTSKGDQQRWFVDGRERSFDASAAEWRDAMLTYLETASEKSRVRGKVAEVRGEIASARGDEARLRGEIAAVRGRDAGYAGQVAEVRGAMAERQALIAERNAVQADSRAAMNDRRAELRDREMEVARQARALQRQAREVEATGRGESRSVAPEVVETLARQKAELEQLRQRNEQQVREIKAETARRDAELKASIAEREDVLRQREAKVRAARDSYDADARVAEIKDKIRSAGVQGRVEAGQRRIEKMQVAKKIAEIDARLEPLEARLERAIERVRP